MSAIRELYEDLEQTITAQFVTTMLRDISATKLQSIRTTYEANKRYYTELHQMMAMVKAYAKREQIELPRQTKSRKKIYVALTSNRRFYGSLNRAVMKSFIETLEKSTEADGYVVGQTGQQILEMNPVTMPIKTGVLSKDIPSTAESLIILEAVSAYEEVLVVHPTFYNSFRQEAIVTDISHVPDDSEVSSIPEYICEPDLPELLQFFRKQIRLVLFQRVLLETEVALTAARLMKMQRARERAKELVTEQRHQIHKEENTVRNMRLLETFTGFASEKGL